MTTTNTTTTAPNVPRLHLSDRFDYVTPNDVFAELKAGGSISVQEWPGGQMPDVSGNGGVILLQLEQEDPDGDPMDRVSMHPDESDRLELFARAIEALENARDALREVGYRDYATIRAEADVADLKGVSGLLGGV